VFRAGTPAGAAYRRGRQVAQLIDRAQRLLAEHGGQHTLAGRPLQTGGSTGGPLHTGEHSEPSGVR
jgi:hypothetical protein